MAMKCSVCGHPELEAINKALVSGQSNRSVAAKYNLSVTSVRRHKENHLPKSLVKAQARKEIVQADSVMGDVSMIRSRLLTLLDIAEREGDIKNTCTVIKELRSTIELLAKVSGELETKTEINIIQNNTWIEIRTCVIDALKPYPEARRAVIHALEGR